MRPGCAGLPGPAPIHQARWMFGPPKRRSKGTPRPVSPLSCCLPHFLSGPILNIHSVSLELFMQDHTHYSHSNVELALRCALYHELR
jgi:hypothetical protein